MVPFKVMDRCSLVPAVVLKNSQNQPASLKHILTKVPELLDRCDQEKGCYDNGEETLESCFVTVVQLQPSRPVFLSSSCMSNVPNQLWVWFWFLGLVPGCYSVWPHSLSWTKVPEVPDVVSCSFPLPPFSLDEKVFTCDSD